MKTTLFALFFSISLIAAASLRYITPLPRAAAPAGFNANTYGSPTWWTDGTDSTSASMILSGSSVTTWKNKGSASSSNWTKGTAYNAGATNPTLTANVVNGNSAVSFNGTSDVMISANSTFLFTDPSNPYTLCHLAYPNGSPGGNFWGLMTGNNGVGNYPGYGYTGVGGYANMYFGGGGQYTGRYTGSISEPGWHLFCLIYNGAGGGTAGNYTAYLDGSSITISSSGGVGAGYPGMIASDTNGYFSGYIMQIVVYPAALSGSNLTNLQNALRALAGI